MFRDENGLLPFFFLLLLIIAAIFGFLRSSYFSVDKVLVEGNRSFTDEEVTVYAGIVQGQNLFQVDLRRIKSRLESNPKIAEAVVRRKWPSSIVIAIKEREPLAIIPYHGYFIEVDRAGVAIGVLESFKNRGVPLLSGLIPYKVGVGHLVEAEGLDVALEVIAGLGREVLFRISEVNVKPGRGVTVYTIDGTRALLGWDKPPVMASRGEKLGAILEQVWQEGRRIESIDLRFERRPVIYVEPRQAGKTR